MSFHHAIFILYLYLFLYTLLYFILFYNIFQIIFSYLLRFSLMNIRFSLENALIFLDLYLDY
jgi:hypothetical protein